MVILYIKIQNKYKVGSVVGGILGKLNLSLKCIAFCLAMYSEQSF